MSSSPPIALVTGASRGLGLETARQLTARLDRVGLLGGVRAERDGGPDRSSDRHPGKPNVWVFDHWEGACAANLGISCSVTISASKSTRAFFVRDTL